MKGTKRKTMVLFVAILLMAISIFAFPRLIEVTVGDIGNISEVWHNSSTLTVTVYHAYVTINFYDLRNSSGVSQLNKQIDVDQSYCFIINVTCPNNWTEVEYINITAWYDNGDENSYYNETPGGNLNLFLQYKNITTDGTGGTAEYNMLWPTGGEVIKGGMEEQVINETCHNITLWFTPKYQFRYAPGDGSWDNTKNATNDPESWNFKIEIVTEGGNVTWIKDEFGVYHYCSIVSVGNPMMAGLPGENATADPITLIHRANANFSISVDIDDLQETHGYDVIPKTAVGLKGGDKTSASNFDGVNPIYIYGSSSSYHDHDVSGTQHTTSDIVFHCNIPFGTLAGVYETNVYYHLVLDPS